MDFLSNRNQNQHLLRIKTVLGDDALFISGINASLKMSDMYALSVGSYSDKHHDIQPKNVVGTVASIVVVDENGIYTHYNGFVSSLTKEAPALTGQATQYQLVVEPWLKFLSHDSDCRIFQNMTAEQVIKKIFEPYKNVASFAFNLTQPLAEKRYQVQYNESNLDFFNRICFYSGLAYYFTFGESGDHKLHIIDKGTSPPPLTPAIVHYQPGNRERDHLTDWKRVSRYATGHFEQNSYNYKTPSVPISAKKSVTGDIAKVPRVSETAMYQYIEDFASTTEIDNNTAIRTDQIAQKNHFVLGAGDCRFLKVGAKFSVLPVPATQFFPDKGKNFVLTEVSFTAHNSGNFNAEFVAVPQGEIRYPDYYPIAIPGMQTAVVTGPAGEEIYTDPEGRVKVQFHWDRLGGHDENTTCWLRVMQSFAGPNFGAQFTPRIGQEVVVAFENGNPDRPFVIGAMYHPENPPPYAKHKGTRNGIRTRSTKGGSLANRNELYFEDKKGKEELYLQAEKDHNTVIKNDETREVGNNQKITVGVDKNENVGNNEQHIVGKNLFIKAGSSIRIEVGGSVIEMTGGKIKVSSGKVDIDGGKIELN